MTMDIIKVESQWNGKNEMMLNIPHFPHLHSSLSSNYKDYQRYPHPLEYFLISLSGTITLTIKDFTDLNKLIITNLYLDLEAILDGNFFKEIKINIYLNSSATPEQLTTLQKKLTCDDPIFNLFNESNKIIINWE